MVSTHIWYDRQGRDKVSNFTCELTVPEGKDPIETFYMACGFSRGYFGMQVNSETERRILFSIWDDGKGGTVDTVDSHKDATVKPFGGEGEGMQAYIRYPWKTDQCYKFWVTAKPEPEKEATVYSGYFWFDEKWQLIGSFRAPSDGGYLRGIYSFLENFGDDYDSAKKCLYGYQWLRAENEDWIQVTQCTCTNTNVPDSGAYYNFGVDKNCFFMEIDGDKCKNCESSNPGSLSK